ncbi:MAG: hypothetical protein COB81_07780, partial [Flavobacteriaceae bacterium]
GLSGSFKGAGVLAAFGPVGAFAGSVFGYASGVTYGAWVESDLPALPDTVDYIPSLSVPNPNK